MSDIYNEGEMVRVLTNVGKEGSANFIAKNSIVQFIKYVHNPDDFGKGIVVVKHNDNFIPVKDLSVSKLNPKEYAKYMKKFNSELIKNNPELGLYHHNFFVRLYYRFLFLFKKSNTNKKQKDLSKIKDIINLKEN